MGEVGRIGAQKRPGRAVVYTRAPAVDRRRYDGRLPMRWLALTLAAVLALPAAAAAQVDWARAYKDAVDAFKKGNDALAEQKFKEARDHPRAPKQSRKRNFSSARLSSRSSPTTTWALSPRARDATSGAGASSKAGPTRRPGHGKPSERNTQLATSSLERAPRPASASSQQHAAAPADGRADPAAPPSNTYPPPPPTGHRHAKQPDLTVTPFLSAVTPPPVRPPPPVNTEPAWLPAFRKSMDALPRSALRQSRYAEARSSLASAAPAPAGDAARRQEADLLRRDIDAAQTIDAQRVAPERARTAIWLKNIDAALTQVATLDGPRTGHPSLP